MSNLMPVTQKIQSFFGPRPCHLEKQTSIFMLNSKKNGCRRKEDGAGKEWFYATLDDVEKAFNQVVHGVKRKNGFDLRGKQKEAVEKAVKWFNKEHSYKTIDSASHKNRFLLNAKMRFGKCFTGIHIAKAIKAQKTIVVTYKPHVIGEWMEAINEHVDFDGWTGIRAKKGDSANESFLTENGGLSEHSSPFVLCVSLQDLDISGSGQVKDRLKEVLRTNWDLLIFDEVHFGGETKRVENILKHVKPNFRLDLSGTPFRLIGAVDFCPEQVFTYSYIDEQESKKKEIADDPQERGPFTYREMPDLILSTIEITDEDIKSQREKFFVDEIDFSLNELFKTKKSEFVYDSEVDNFLESLCKRGNEANDVSVYGRLGDKLGLPKKRHSVWWLYKVDSIKLLIKKMKRHPVFSRYEIINAAGGKSDKELDDVFFAKSKDALSRKINSSNEKDGTIALTCKRFLTGVTIPEWDSILVLNDAESAESYFQAIFRIQSSWVENKEIKKKKGWVFDFAISRCLRTVYEYAKMLSNQTNREEIYDKKISNQIVLEKRINEFCKLFYIKRFYKGSLKGDPTTSKDVFEAVDLAQRGIRLALAKRITGRALVPTSFSLSILEQFPELFEILKKVKGYRTQEAGPIDNVIKIGKRNFKRKRSNDKGNAENESMAESTEDRKNKKLYADKIKRLSICMADFIYMTQFREHTIDDVIEKRDSKFFKVVTGITKDNFTELCNKGFISRNALNEIVGEFRRQEESSLSPEEYIASHLEKPRRHRRGIWGTVKGAINLLKKYRKLQKCTLTFLSRRICPLIFVMGVEKSIWIMK